jgi:hypothetical protein
LFYPLLEQKESVLQLTDSPIQFFFNDNGLLNEALGQTTLNLDRCDNFDDLLHCEIAQSTRNVIEVLSDATAISRKFTVVLIDLIQFCLDSSGMKLVLSDEFHQSRIRVIQVQSD